jgi:drug/metabolite transporter (DMT)-like permease
MFSLVSNDTFANYISMPVSGILWVVAFIFANEHKISPIESNFARYICQIIIQIPLMYFSGQPFYLKHEKDMKLLIIRAIISSFNGVATAIFQMFLPLTVYYTLSASTLIFTFLLNYWLFKADLSVNQIKAIIVALLGIALVINGRNIYQIFDSNYQFSSNFDYSSTSTSVIFMVSIGVVAWSFVWAYGIVITGKHHSSIN